MGQKKRSKKVLLKRILMFTVLGFVAVIIGLALYMWNLSAEIDKRFSARRWSIPSRVYSDSTLLYAGQTVNLKLFYEKLSHLDYRDVSRKPELKGEMHRKESSIDIYLDDLKTPSKQREGFPVRITFEDNRIVSIEQTDTNQQVPILELEPEEIMLFFGREREQRRLVSIKQIPVYLTYAVLSAEDSRFCLHHGIDPRGILRALYTNIRQRGIRQGGSTLTQQLVKNYFLTPARTLRRKFKEFLMAVDMELMYDKNTIFEIYLNEIYFGQKGSIAIHGVGEASYYYFGKPVQGLSLAEAATIAGLIKSPNRYSPYIDPKRCEQRRNTILHEIYKNKWITKEERDFALASPVKPVGYNAVYGKKGPYFIDYLSGQLPIIYSPKDLASLGLSIYTTFDTQVQMAAERALENGLTRLKKAYPALRRAEANKKLQGAIIVMQPKTGYILAMAGGRNYSVSQFNRVTQARRQPGSAFKPFVYLTALSESTPSSILSNEPKAYEIDGKVWQPQNVNPVAEHGLRLRTALATSDNLATVDLAMKVGLKSIVNTARTFQFSTPMAPLPSLALGAFEVIPLELARAYCTFAADGAQPYPLSMKAVVDEKGRMLEQRHLKIKSLISPGEAYIMNSLLRSVVTDGTARPLAWRGITFPVAGKTGTTNGYRDAWFVGYTPDILALVWVGFDNDDSVYAGGATAALPIWAELMKALPQYTSKSWFRKPPDVVTRKVCSQSGQLAVISRCPEPLEEIFLKNNVPSKYCPLHN
jgi:penicillin-binding protein 1B